MMELAKSFALLSETDRRNTVRKMLLAVTSRQHETNELLQGDTTSRKRSRNTYQDAYCTMRYCIRGKGVRRAVLSAIFQIHPRTVNRLGKMVVSSESFQLADGVAKTNCKEKLTVQSVVSLEFLKRYSELNAMLGPTGRDSADEDPIHW
ncbi:hypothetical protein BWQ96_08127 [Gracilariopsis chorda]|uniref:Uncharacterized protein n=1 Tax=Gracilariopsis chorda TaxID=448386 RepID=A0A2V3IJB7_9FLOR|nr:hypothetical protein BWQ96_08127 [Gracilariopsis chorda]|eukprot:PXF42149.1 hypothetical protein BWQ96_08127 [Gracilariopsis chorda]